MKNFKITLILLAIFWLTSCDGFLDEKPNKSILVPETIADFEAIIDNYDRINISPILPFMFSDDYWTTGSNWQSFNPWQQNAYKWSNDPFLPEDSPLDFSILYRKIFSANVVLDKTSEIPDWPEADLNRLKGKALFWRAHGYFELAVLYLPVPGMTGDSPEIKLPLRSTADFEARVEWKTSIEIFNLVISDLEESLLYLPKKTVYPTQPSFYSGHALLARIHLYLGNLEKAIMHAQEVLKGDFALLDYSKLNMSSPFPVALFNSETILFTVMGAQSTVSGNNVAFVNPDLIKSYASDDLRLGFLVKNSAGNTYFKGGYTAKQDVFSGIALDEILLILAESNVRQGRVEEGLAQLNLLLVKRKKNFIPPSIDSIDNTLEWVLDARRKSLLFRGQRWADLKRTNSLYPSPRILRRQLGNEQILLTASAENMIQKIPQREIALQ